jgi:hypothetical protein
MVWYVFDGDGWTCQRSEEGRQQKESLAPVPGQTAFQHGFAQAVMEWAQRPYPIGPMYLTVPEGGLGGTLHKYNVQRPQMPHGPRKRHPLVFWRREDVPPPSCYGIFTDATSRHPARQIETARDSQAVLARLLELAESPRQELAPARVSF